MNLQLFPPSSRARRGGVALRPFAKERASVLVGLLWCLALLSVVVIGVLYSSRLDLQVAKNTADTIQARYLALAAIEKAKALLYQDERERQRSARHHSGALYDAPEHFRDVPLGRGLFSVIRQSGPGETRGIIYGVSDEESRLNINRAQNDALAKIRGMTPDVIAALQDWRDGDTAVTPGGAEAEYYASRKPPVQPRNGPLETLQEFLMIRDVPRDLFLGEDTNQNGLLDPWENDGGASPPNDNRDGILDTGWAGLFTTDSAASGNNAGGHERIDIRSADERALSAVRSLSADMVRAIIAYRGQNQFKNVTDLLDVTPPAPPGSPTPSRPANAPTAPGSGPGPGPVNRSVRTTGGPAGAGPTTAEPVATGARSGAPTGPRLITPETLMEIADDVTATDDDEQAGVINVNTAGPEVLACLPGLTPELAQAIVAHRRSAGFFPNVAWLLKVDGLSPEILKQLWPKVTVRSETFRILGEGRVPSTGARQRVEKIVRLTRGSFQTLSYREDL
jgi:DNA uptake protein ComE-like DNA-binding protein